MYEYIKGSIEELEIGRVVVESMGIGYVANISLQSHEELAATAEGEQVKLYVHQYQVRDDLPILFGFFSKGEREVFRMLIAVSGVGGGTACNILSTFSPSELRTIISTGDSATLKRVKGLGVKTAEKTIVELRDKIIKIELDSSMPQATQAAPAATPIFDEALSALTMLGFSRQTSAKALEKVISEMPKAKIEDVVRMALKRL